MTTQAIRTGVVPGSVGTFHIPQLDAVYTVGRDHVAAAVEQVMRQPGPLSVDIETDGLGVLAMNVKVVTVGNAQHAVVCDPRDPYQRKVIMAALQAARVLVLHNSPFDVPILYRNGLLRYEDINKVVDTLTYCRLAEPDEKTSKGLLSAGARYMGADPVEILTTAFKAAGYGAGRKEVGGQSFKLGDAWKVFDIDRPVYVQGAAIDVITTARILPKARAAALVRIEGGHTSNGGPFAWAITGADAERLVEREQVLNRMFLRRSAKGIRVDLEYLDNYKDAVGQANTAHRDLLAEVGVAEGNGNSLIAWLETNGLIPEDYPRTDKTKKPSSVAANLETLHHPVVNAFIGLKKNEKVAKDYLQKVVDLADDDNRIHPTVNMLAAVTGRMSIGDPPLQQFPGDKEDDDNKGAVLGARGILMADEGDAMTSIDWSQIEPVVAAYSSRDSQMIERYEAGGTDFYTVLSEQAGVKRKEAKVILLAQMYGESVPKMAAKHGWTNRKGYNLRDTVFQAMPGVARLIERLKAIGSEHGQIFTVSGRIVPVPWERYEARYGKPAREGYAVHKAVNYFCQGSAYDVLAESMVRVEEAGLGDAVYLAVHDELVVSTAAAKDIERIMKQPPERLIKMAGRMPVLKCDSLDLGERWAAA